MAESLSVVLPIRRQSSRKQRSRKRQVYCQSKGLYGSAMLQSFRGLPEAWAIALRAEYDTRI